MILIVFLLLLVFLLYEIKKSTFETCQVENRQYPEGKLPGSQLGLTKYELMGLTQYIKNNPNIS